jgi:hypothetical protein
MPLPPEIAALVGSREAPCAFLVRFHFVSGIKRVWAGFGALTTLDGQVWSGLGELGSIDGLSTALNATAPSGRLTVSGVDASLLSIAVGETDDFAGRPVAIFLQAFNGRSLSGNPCAIAVRLMTALEVTRTADARSLSISHETPYTGRNRPAGGFYSDRDQQKRYPGDTFCERTPLLIFQSRLWPDY